MSSETIVIKKRSDETQAYLATVIDRGDVHSEAIGFLPQAAYEDAVRQDKLFVAVAQIRGVQEYAGHLLFGGARPHLRVFQIFVDPGYRRHRVGSTLIDELVQEAEEGNYLTVSARVADDLPDANGFWQYKGFDVVKAIAGGSSKGRIINVRVRHLNSPTLFTAPVSLGSSPLQDLRLYDRPTPASPVFSLDVNAVLDIVDRRPRYAVVCRILGAAMNSIVRLRVAPEFIKELERAHIKGQRDPLLEFAKGLPQFPPVPKEIGDRLFLELAALVFPAKLKRGNLRPRDQSDLHHLIAAIYHRADGFATSEDGLLKRRLALRANHRLDILSVAELAELVAPDASPPRAQVDGAGGIGSVCIRQIHETAVRESEQFLMGLGIPSANARDLLSAGPADSPRRRYGVFYDQAQIGFASWDPPQNIKEVDVAVLTEDANPAARSAADYLLDVAIRDACKRGPSLMRLADIPTGPALLEVAMARGFRPAAGPENPKSGRLKKICVGRVLDQECLIAVRSEVQRLTGVLLPAQLPDYSGPETPFRMTAANGVEVLFTVDQIEVLLGPVLFLLPRRDCAVVPIKPAYAKALLEIGSQLTMFRRRDAVLFSERVYYSHARTASVLAPGTLILFYESSESARPGAAVACARVVRSALGLQTDVPTETQQKGVLRPEEIERLGGNLTYFDNMLRFKKPVGIRRLREIGCGRGTMVTSKRISLDEFRRVIKEGEPIAL